MGRQKELAGIERPKVQEIEDAAEVYVKSRNKRMKANEAEKADKDALIEVMKKHKLISYKTDDGETVTITVGKSNVKVSADEGDAIDDDGDEEASPKKPTAVN